MIFNRKIFWQTALAFLLIIAMCVGGVYFYVVHSLGDFFQNHSADRIRSEAFHLKHYFGKILEENKNFSEIDGLCDKLGTKTKTRITVILPSGKVIGDSEENPKAMDNHRNRPEIYQAFNGKPGRAVRFSKTLQKEMIYYCVPIKNGTSVVAAIRTSMPVNIPNSILQRARWKFAAAGLLVILAGGVLAFILSGKISGSIKYLQKGAKSFSEGNLDFRLHPEGPEEIRSLGTTLNEMARKLKEKLSILKEERNKIQAILSGMTEGLIALDQKGTIITINEAAIKLLGLSPEDLENAKIYDIVRIPEMIETIDSVLESGKNSGCEFSCTGEKERILKVRVSPLESNNPGVSGVIVLISDITRTKKLERIRKDFVANVSHELKTPVTSIKGFVETLLGEAGKNPEKRKEFLEIILKHTNNMDDIISDLLKLSKIEKGIYDVESSFRKEKIRNVLESVKSKLEKEIKEKDISLKIQCPETLELKMDPGMIRQALINILDNAVKYSPEHSSIEVTVEERNNRVEIKVRDEGRGIKKREQSRIFERFYRGKETRNKNRDGTGLGLSLAKHIVSTHNGNIKVESEPGEGSIFTIRIPSG